MSAKKSSIFQELGKRGESGCPLRVTYKNQIRSIQSSIQERNCLLCPTKLEEVLISVVEVGQEYHPDKRRVRTWVKKMTIPTSIFGSMSPHTDQELCYTQVKTKSPCPSNRQSYGEHSCHTVKSSLEWGSTWESSISTPTLCLTPCSQATGFTCQIKQESTIKRWKGMST